MSTDTKSRICEVLGVEENEEWYYPGLSGPYRIHGGARQCKYKGEWFDCTNEQDFALIVESPGRIIRKLRFTEHEMRLMRMFYAAAPNAVFVREENEQLYLVDIDEFDIKSLMPKALLPSLLPGQSVSIREVIAKDAHAND